MAKILDFLAVLWYIFHDKRTKSIGFLVRYGNGKSRIAFFDRNGGKMSCSGGARCPLGFRFFFILRDIPRPNFFDGGYL